MGCGIGDVEPWEDPGLPNPGGRDIRRSTSFWVDDVDILCNEHSPPGFRCLKLAASSCDGPTDSTHPFLQNCDYILDRYRVVPPCGVYDDLKISHFQDRGLTFEIVESTELVTTIVTYKRFLLTVG